jgi:hypothetical protein
MPLATGQNVVSSGTAAWQYSHDNAKGAQRPSRAACCGQPATALHWRQHRERFGLTNELGSDFTGISAEDLYDSESPLVPGRSCGSCTLCCKLMFVPELNKPADVMCSYAAAGKGCTIHERRPGFCHQYFCGWRLDPNIDALWKPEISGFLLSINLYYGALMVMVDPERPLAWKMQPYHGRLREWSARAFKENKRIVAMVAGEATVVLPDRDVPIGRLGQGDEIALSTDGSGYHAELRKKGSAASRSAAG